MAAKMTTSSENNDEDRFNKMEHRNWEQGYEAYDRGFGPLTRQTIPTLLANAGFPRPADAGGDERTVRLLDVATGPGFVLSAAIDAAAKQQQQSYNYHLTGIDITHNFLRLAEERTDAQLQQQKQQPAQIKVDFVEGSAESLPFADNTFDSIVCNFGILHFFRPDSFLRESFRVLRPGGKVSVSAWAPPTRSEGFSIAVESISEGGNPNVKGLPEGPDFFDYGDSTHAMSALREVGFEDVNSFELSEMTWDVPNGEVVYDVLANGTSRTREILLGQTPEETTAIQSLMVKKYNSITDGVSRPLSMPAVITSGQKPF